MKLEDLKKGEIYYTKNVNESSFHIFKFKGLIDKDAVQVEFTITDGYFNSVNRYFHQLYLDNLRPANDEEIHWYNECVRANRFIPRKDLVPEYLELYTKGYADKYLGKIFKTSNHYVKYDYWPDCKSYQEWWESINNLHHSKYFRPSTKEAYENQQKTNEKPKFEVGKWYTHPNWSPNSYIKFSSIRDYNSVFELERISQGIYNGINSNWSISYEHTLIPVDLSEIQQYLPDGHPDKIISLVGRYLMYIGNNKIDLPKYGGYFKITSDKPGCNLLRLHDNVPDCMWEGTNSILSGECKSFKLMPENFTIPIKKQMYTKDVNSEELPEKWCVKVTQDNWEIVTEWYNKQCRTNCYTKNRVGCYLASHTLTNEEKSIIKGTYITNCILYSPNEEFPEITFEQFKKYVLKENSDESIVINSSGSKTYNVGIDPISSSTILIKPVIINLLTKKRVNSQLTKKEKKQLSIIKINQLKLK